MWGYAFKRIVRNWPLFIAVIAGVLVSSTMFATTNIGSNEIVRKVVDDALEDIVIDYQIIGFEAPPSCAALTSLADDVATITNVRHTEVLSHLSLSTFSVDMYTGIESDSYAYHGITHISGATTLGVNQTFMAISSTNTSQYQLNDFVEFTFQVWDYPNVFNYTISLEIVGFIEADSAALQILTGMPYWSELPRRNLFIMDWEATMCPIRETIIDVAGISPFIDEIDVFVDRDAVISGVDIEGSLNKLATIRSQIANKVGFTATVWSPIETGLQFLSLNSMILFILFMVMSVPIFFVALYMGITFSDVTFNLRRREVGLLLTKGFSRRSLLHMFILEAIIIGLLAGAVGILLAILIVPFFVGTSEGWQLISPYSIGLDTIALCMIFSCVVTFISVYFSARRATQIPTVEALRQYRYVPQDKGYRKLFAWSALLLGFYKMIIWSTGFSVREFVTQIPVTSFLLFMGLMFWVGFDQMVTPWAMMLFLYGLAKIVVHGTTILYRIIGKVLRSGLGDIGELATRSVQRNPARTSAVIF
ncbi:MAG: ABC transporter permease, partial [Promethearchaeota archaeon]